jgi:hypothetical protein
MKKILRIPVKAALFAVWAPTIPLLFILGIVPLMFIIIFLIWLFDDYSESFWKMYKEEIVDFWDFLSFKTLTSEDK